MDTFQASDVEDWGRLERAKAILGAITVPNDVLQTEGGEASRIEIPKEDIPLLKELAKDQTLLHFSNAKPFVEWLERLANEPKVDIEGDDDEAFSLRCFLKAFSLVEFCFSSLRLVEILRDPFPFCFSL